MHFNLKDEEDIMFSLYNISDWLTYVLFALFSSTHYVEYRQAFRASPRNIDSSMRHACNINNRGSQLSYDWLLCTTRERYRWGRLTPPPLPHFPLTTK